MGMKKEAKSDSQIVEQVLAGNKDEYAELVRRHQKRLRSVLSVFCHSQDEVDEFLEESFVQAYLHLNQFKPAAEFFPWLKTIAVNELRMKIRHREAEGRKASEYLKHVQMVHVEDDPEADEAELKSRSLDICMKKLEGPGADLVWKRYAEETPLEDLACRFRTTKNNLAVKLHRLRELLDKCIRTEMKRLREAVE